MKSLLRLIQLVIILLISFQSLHSQNFVKANGQWLTDTLGKPFIPIGTNLGNWLVPEGYMFKTGEVSSAYRIDEMFNILVGPEKTRKFWDAFLENYITKEDIVYLRSLGFNHIRLPFHYKLFTSEDYLGRNYHGFEYFDKVLEWCRETGLYVLFDMHCAPCGQTGDNIDDSYGYPYLFESSWCQEKFINVWREIAGRYANDPVVMGYGLLNEPIATHFTGAIPRLNKELEPLYKRAVEAIREVDKHHLIVLGGAQWNNNFSVFGKPFDDNLMYEFHKYWFEVKEESIREYLDFRAKYNVPVYLGESGENTDEWVNSFRALLDKNQIGWAFWPYKKLNSTSCIVSIVEPESWKLITSFAASDRSTYQSARENLPDRGTVHQAMQEYLESCRFRNCKPNDGYIRSLGAGSDH